MPLTGKPVPPTGSLIPSAIAYPNPSAYPSTFRGPRGGREAYPHSREHVRRDHLRRRAGASSARSSSLRVARSREPATARRRRRRRRAAAVSARARSYFHNRIRREIGRRRSLAHRPVPRLLPLPPPPPQAKALTRASSRHTSRAARLTARAAGGDKKDGADGADVYIGKGRWVKDDPKKYAGRDDWFTGGWPGGEVGLKESFIQEPIEVDSGPTSNWAKLPEEFDGEDTVYVGKGKYLKADAKAFAGRDNLVTGGWAGGEVGLKLDKARKLKAGDYVAIKGSGGNFFQRLFSADDTRKTGTVKKVDIKASGKVTVSVAVLPFDNVEEFSDDQLEIID